MGGGGGQALGRSVGLHQCQFMYLKEETRFSGGLARLTQSRDIYIYKYQCRHESSQCSFFNVALRPQKPLIQLMLGATGPVSEDDELMLNVLRCQLTY